MSSIGVFDSGLGGLSVMRELVRELPHENITYIADSANCPYGQKAKEEIVQLLQRVVQFLLDKECKIIVVACNTATTAAIAAMRARYPEVPFVGVEPAVKPAAQQSRSKRIGILATAATLKSLLFEQTVARYAKGVQVYSTAGEGLVELVESGEENSAEAVALLRQYLQPMMDKGVDKLVLGCTHYPFLSRSIHEVTRGTMELIDPAPAIVSQTKRLLKQRSLLDLQAREPAYSFYTTGSVAQLEQMQTKLLGLPNASYNRV